MAIRQKTISIRRLTQDDLPAALAIQAASYPAFLLDGPEAFASRIAMRSSYCLAAERDGMLTAYLLAHGWPAHTPPPIDTVLAKDSASDILFIHDLAVSSSEQGSGIGRQLIRHAFSLAGEDHIRSAELIAVDGAADYWRALGFAETTPTPALAAKVAAYGADARWMTREI